MSKDNHTGGSPYPRRTGAHQTHFEEQLKATVERQAKNIRGSSDLPSKDKQRQKTNNINRGSSDLPSKLLQGASRPIVERQQPGLPSEIKQINGAIGNRGALASDWGSSDHVERQLHWGFRTHVGLGVTRPTSKDIYNLGFIKPLRTGGHQTNAERQLQTGGHQTHLGLGVIKPKSKDSYWG